MTVSIIVACDPHNVIGKNGKLPWRCKEDLKLFRERTMGHPIIMGRKTWESIPKKPLDGRLNIVITRNVCREFDPSHFHFCSIELALKALKENANLWQYKDKEVFIIGGSQIYRQALDSFLVDKIYMTKIRKNYDGDVSFPTLSPQWNVKSLVSYEEFDLFIYEKIDLFKEHGV